MVRAKAPLTHNSYISENNGVVNLLKCVTGTNPSEPPVPPLPISCFKSHMYAEDCHVIRNASGTRTLGISLRLFTPTNNVLEPRCVNFEREVLFGEDAQSVVAKLGTPSRIFYKSDDKMKIHSREAHKKVMNINSDYFFNYFTLGLVNLNITSHPFPRLS